MALTLLQILQQVADKVGIQRPTAVLGSNASEVQELLTYAQEEGRQLVKAGDWQALTREKTFTSLAQEVQTGMVATDLDRFLVNTFWNRSRRRPLLGPITPQVWQQQKSWTVSPVQDQFRQRGNDILVMPVPPAGETFAYEYITRNFCASSGGTEQDSWQADTDVPLLRDYLFVLGIAARYLLGNNLPADAMVAEYNVQVQQALSQDGVPMTLYMGSNNLGVPRPGIIVPEGDWSV